MTEPLYLIVLGRIFLDFFLRGFIVYTPID